MEATEFNNLNYQHQDELIFTHAIKVGSINTEWEEIDLYRFEGLLVEHRFIKDHEHNDFHALESEKEVEPYKFLLN